MNRTRRILSTIATTFAFLAATAATAVAGDPELYDWPSDESPILVKSDAGILLLGADGTPRRALSWNPNDGDDDQPARLVDMTGDGSPEIIGSGSPTFITDSAGVPALSIDDGCDQVTVGDVGDHDGLGLVCVDGSRVSLYRGSGSRAWSMNVNRNIDYCRIGDLTHNNDNDIECKYRGRDQYLRIRPEGEAIDTSADSQTFEEPGEELAETQPVAGITVDGDVDIGGEDPLTITVDGDTITIGDTDDEESEPTTIDGVAAATTTGFGDLDDQQLVALTDDRIYVIADGGRAISDYSTDPSGYSRTPRAEYYSLNVNGFEDNEEVRELVRTIQDDLSQCYGSRMRSDPYAGSGRYILQYFIGEDGSIQQLNERTNRVRDDQLESCTKDAVRSLDYPGAEAGRAVVTLNLLFTFVDEEG